MRMLRRAPQGTPPKSGQKAAQPPARSARPSRTSRASGSPLAAGRSFGRHFTEGFRKFIFDTRAELKKVVWPTREQAMNLTALVIGVSIAVGAFIGGVDALLQRLFQLIIGGA